MYNEPAEVYCITSGGRIHQNTKGLEEWYSKPCVKRPLQNRQNKDINNKW